MGKARRKETGIGKRRLTQSDKRPTREYTRLENFTDKEETSMNYDVRGEKNNLN